MKQTIILLAMVFSFTSCKTVKPSEDKNTVQLSGVIEKAGMSTFQYGTHILKSADKTYALKSTALDLNSYTTKTVSLKGTKVAGYPIENGPDFIEVTSIKENP